MTSPADRARTIAAALQVVARAQEKVKLAEGRLEKARHDRTQAIDAAVEVGTTITDIARMCGVSAPTVHGWRNLGR